MSTKATKANRRGDGPRAIWLLVLLLAFLGASRPICWCSLGAGGHCGGAAELARVRAGQGPSCCGTERPRSSARAQSERAGTDGYAPVHDCRCLEGDVPVAVAADGRSAHAHDAPTPLAATRVPLFTAGAPTLAKASPAVGAPGGSSPPLFLVNCIFRC